MTKLESDIKDIRQEIRLAKWIPSCVSIVCAIFCKWAAPSPPTAQPVEKEQRTSIDASGNTVNVGLESAKTDPQRDWLTVAEVAKKEGKRERTITDYIEKRRIPVKPVIEGERAHKIPRDYVLLPPQPKQRLTADNGGN